MHASISVQRLAVEAAVHGDDKPLRQAFMMDPLVGAVCNPKEIWRLVDEMLVAGEAWLPQYAASIAEAKARLTSDNLIPTRPYEGAVRLKVKTVEEMHSTGRRRTKTQVNPTKGRIAKNVKLIAH